MILCFYDSMIFCLERAHGCLGGRSRGAWAASPGLLGHVSGGPRGGVPAESLQIVGGYASRGFASKMMSILMSIFSRLGVHLGSLLGVIFGHVGAFFGQSWSRNRFRTVLFLKKVFVHETVYNKLCQALFRSTWRPKTTQDRSKRGPRSSWTAFCSS